MLIDTSRPPLATHRAARAFPSISIGAVTIAVGMLLAAGAVLALFLRAADSLPGDFQTYYAAASDISSGAPLYSDALQWREVGGTIELPRLFEDHPQLRTDYPPYVYPPAFAFAMLPLAQLPLNVAEAVWFALIAGCVLGTSFVLTRVVCPMRMRYQLAIALGMTVLLSVFQPIRATLASAQVDPLLLFLVTLALWAFIAHKDSRAALFLALAVAIKPTVAFLIVFFIWKRAYRATAIFAATSAVLLVLPTLFLGVGQVTDFVLAARYWSSPSFTVTPFNQAPYGLLLRLFTVNAFTSPVLNAPLLVPVLQGFLIGATLILLAKSIRRTRDLPVGRTALEYGLVLIGMLIVSPLSEDIHYGYLVIPLAASLAGVLRSRQLGAVSATIGAVVALCWVYFSLPSLRAMDMVFRTFQQAPVAAPKLLMTGMHIYGLLALLCIVVLLLLWRRSPIALESTRSW